MKKFLTTVLFGFACFLSGVATQYVLPVAGWNKLMDCEEIEEIIVPSTLSENLHNDDPSLTNKEQEIKTYAQKITVKVFSGQNSGSGILIKRNGNTYQVVTNDHVLLFGRQDQAYKIKTPDGNIYVANPVNQFNFKNYDLGVLQFVSDQVYEVSSFSQLPTPNIGEKVYAAGFPYLDNSNDDDFMFTTGTVNLISDLSFRGGYKIGYTNDVKKGMSGGPLLNENRQIVGINGRHKYPAWGNPYIFEDGTTASPEKKEEMSQYSWAIPINTFMNYLQSPLRFD